MSVYLEAQLKMFPDSKYLFTEDDHKKAPNRFKSHYTLAFRDNVWQKPEFIALVLQVAPFNKNGFPMVT